MPPSGVDYASEFLNGYAPEYVLKKQVINDNDLEMLDNKIRSLNFNLYKATGNLRMSMPLFPIKYISVWRKNHNSKWLRLNISIYKFLH